MIAGQSPPSFEVSDFEGDGLPFLQGNAEFGPLHPVPIHRCDSAPKRCSRHDVLLSVRAPVGALNVADQTYGIGRGLCAVRPHPGTNERFLWWVLNSLHNELDRSSVGSTYAAVTAEDVDALPIPRISESAQRAIADFLDAETTRIDALITKKRKQSTLVDLRWSALVTELVRGRHTASANRRPSGVGWIEELPEEWGTPSVGMMFDVELGKMLNQRAAEGENQLPYLRNQNVQWDRFDLEDVATMHFDPDDRGRFKVRKGDLLVCEGGDVGRAAMWSSEAEIHYQKALHRVRPRTSAPPRFLMYVLWAASSLGVFAIEGNQSTIVHLTREQLRAHRVPWPPEEQQRQIVAELDKARAKMRDIQERLAQQIALLAEHRQALITAAVTGRIEVPEATAS
ncbi:MAG: restriction endonuclease subunit S [Actinobacteria bacterium]|nr:restriction endonuclease subunit S [Actinomycetota bacterium]